MREKTGTETMSAWARAVRAFVSCNDSLELREWFQTLFSPRLTLQLSIGVFGVGSSRLFVDHL